MRLSSGSPIRKMRGYTLIELLVTITIVVLVTGTSMSLIAANENKALRHVALET